MGMIFPLSWAGKIALILIAVALGIIFSMLQWPDFWRKLFKRQGTAPVVSPSPTKKK